MPSSAPLRPVSITATGTEKTGHSKINNVTGVDREFTYDKLNRLVAGVDSGSNATQATGTVTIGGSEGSKTTCTGSGRNTCTTVYDSGEVSLTVNGFTALGAYNKISNTSSAVAQNLTNSLNASGSPVTARVSGNVITLTSIDSGTAANYSMSTGYAGDFTVSLSGTTLTGGTTGTPPAGGLNQQYTLDNWGNLTRISGGISLSATQQNQIYPYLYYANGMLQNDYRYQYTYDSNGMLLTSSDGAGYVYDGNEQRASLTLGGTETDYYYFGGRLYASYSSSGWTDMIYAGGQRIATVAGTQAATPTFDVVDHLGSEVATVNGSGAVVSTLDYTPFGQLLNGSSSDGFVFTGLLRDNDGLDHADFRQYSSTTARWITPDPYDGSYTFDNPQSFNRYGYVGNMPKTLTDPSGQVALAPVYPDLTTDLILGAIDLAALGLDLFLGQGPAVSAQQLQAQHTGKQLQSGAGTNSAGSPCPVNTCVTVNASSYAGPSTFNIPNMSLQAFLQTMSLAGIQVSQFDTKWNVFHNGTQLRSSGSCGAHVTINAGSGVNGAPITGTYHQDYIYPLSSTNPNSLGPSAIPHTFFDVIPDTLPFLFNTYSPLHFLNGTAWCSGVGSY